MKTLGLILAAGNSVRIKSSTPKVLHKVNGIPMLKKVIETLNSIDDVERVVAVLGKSKNRILENIGNLEYVDQLEQLGTGHALLQAENIYQTFDHVLVVPGDVPLIKAKTLMKLIDDHITKKNDITLLTAFVKSSKGYGRILRENGDIKEIVEEKNANEAIKNIKEINSGIYCFSVGKLKEYMPQITKNNITAEYYLTDIIEIGVKNRAKIAAITIENSNEVMGVNDRVDLAKVSKLARKTKAKELMKNGVTLIDPKNSYIEENVKIGEDTTIYPNTIIEGDTIIGKNVTISGNCRISNSIIGDNVRIESSVIENSKIGEFSKIGPFAHIRMDTDILNNTRIGNFVEIKKSTISSEAKICHLSYIGDAEVGAKTNIGAGVITCNFDGKDKHKTFIGEGVFVGSNSSLIAPIEIGNNSFIGAGSVITEDIPSNSLSLERSKQIIKENWCPKNKKD